MRPSLHCRALAAILALSATAYADPPSEPASLAPASAPRSAPDAFVAEAEAPVAPGPTSPEPPVLVWLGDAPPLRSEQRRLDALAKKLSTKTQPMTVAEARGTRAEALRAWLGTVDPTARAALPLEPILGPNRAVLAVWLSPPVDRVGQVARGFGLVVANPPRALFWITGVGPEDEAFQPLKRILDAALVKP